MLVDYSNPDLFFQGNPISTSRIKIGKSKRKLNEIKIEIWSIYREVKTIDVEDKPKDVPYSYIGYKISGALEEMNVSEGFSDFEAIIGVVASIQRFFEYHEKYLGMSFYVENYAGGTWCKVPVSEMFQNLVQKEW